MVTVFVTVTMAVLVLVRTDVVPFRTAVCSDSTSEVDSDGSNDVCVDTVVEGTSVVKSSVLNTVEVGCGVCKERKIERGERG